jgi:N-acetylmuramoyl-L-alanine amidase
MTPVARIVLDAGHGGKDPGAVAINLQEKELNLKITQKILKHFCHYPVEFILTRASDYTVSLEERCIIANQEKADLFLSLHVNAGGGTGFESFIHPHAFVTTRNYQTKIHTAVMNFLRGEGVRDRGMKRADFQVLRETKMPAVLLECLFIDNEQDAALLKSETFLNDLAGAIVQGIVRALELDKESSADEELKQKVKELESKNRKLEAENRELKLLLRKIALETAPFVLE